MQQYPPKKTGEVGRKWTKIVKPHSVRFVLSLETNSFMRRNSEFQAVKLFLATRMNFQNHRDSFSDRCWLWSKSVPVRLEIWYDKINYHSLTGYMLYYHLPVFLLLPCMISFFFVVFLHDDHHLCWFLVPFMLISSIFSVAFLLLTSSFFSFPWNQKGGLRDSKVIAIFTNKTLSMWWKS